MLYVYGIYIYSKIVKTDILILILTYRGREEASAYSFERVFCTTLTKSVRILLRCTKNVRILLLHSKSVRILHRSAPSSSTSPSSNIRILATINSTINSATIRILDTAISYSTS